MKPFSIVIHGGAGEDSDFIHKNLAGFEDGLKSAAEEGYRILEKKGKAIEAVEAAVISLEDNPLFNSGKGSALNNKGLIEMDASIMDGHLKKAGAVSMLDNIRNPVSLARLILEKTNHVYICGESATHLAKEHHLRFEEESYFITEHQIDEYKKADKNESILSLLLKKIKGTVGAVALDTHGHTASATSTGGTVNCLPGRIGDSSIIGAGCYANEYCGVSCTGDGEYLITGVVAYSIVKHMMLTRCSLQEACEFVIHKENKDNKGDLGVIGIDKNGNIGISFNTKRMHRAWIDKHGKLQVRIYQ